MKILRFIPILSIAVLLGAGCSFSSVFSLGPSTAPVDGTINLSDQQLTKIPDDVFEQVDAEELDLSNNDLTGALPAEIRYLQNLKVLNISNNSMAGVPAEIGQLSKLEILDISNNQLTGLPYEIGNLQNLKTLNISGNDYSEQDLQIILEKLPEGVEVIK